MIQDISVLHNDDRYKKLSSEEQQAAEKRFMGYGAEESDGYTPAIQAEAPRPVSYNRGVIGDIGSALYRGAINTAGMAGGALQSADMQFREQKKGFADRIGENISNWAEERAGDDFARPDAESATSDSWAYKSFISGVESIPLSAAPIGMAVGAAAAAPALGLSAGAAAIGAGVVGVGSLFGLGTYHEKRTQLDARTDLSEGEKHDAAFKYAFIEAGGEAVGDLVGYVTLGLGKTLGLSGGAKVGTTAVLRALLRTSPKKIAQGMAATYATEWGTETVQGKLQSDIDGELGLADRMTYLESAIETAIPTAVMTFTFGMFGGAVNISRARKVKADLNAVDIETGEYDVETRIKAAKEVLNGIDDKEFAEGWRVHAMAKIKAGEDITIDDEIEGRALDTVAKVERADNRPSVLQNLKTVPYSQLEELSGDTNQLNDLGITPADVLNIANNRRSDEAWAENVLKRAQQGGAVSRDKVTVKRAENIIKFRDALAESEQAAKPEPEQEPEGFGASPAAVKAQKRGQAKAFYEQLVAQTEPLSKEERDFMVEYESQETLLPGEVAQDDATETVDTNTGEITQQDKAELDQRGKDLNISNVSAAVAQGAQGKLKSIAELSPEAAQVELDGLRAGLASNPDYKPFESAFRTALEKQIKPTLQEQLESSTSMEERKRLRVEIKKENSNVRIQDKSTEGTGRKEEKGQGSGVQRVSGQDRLDEQGLAADGGPKGRGTEGSPKSTSKEKENRTGKDSGDTESDIRPSKADGLVQVDKVAGNLAKNETIELEPEAAWKSSDLATTPNIGDGMVKARRISDRKYVLEYTGTSNEVFAGERFKSATEAIQFFKVQKLKAQEADGSQVEGAVGKPWQVSRGDHRGNKLVENFGVMEDGKLFPFRSDGARVQATQGQVDKFKKLADDEHRASVEYAIKQGENVPAEVLSEYPGLQEKKMEVKTERRNKDKFDSEGNRIDRRVDSPYRKKVDEMTREEMVERLLKDKLTGLDNDRGFWESFVEANSRFVARLDMDNLHDINEIIGYEGANQLIEAIAEEATKQGIYVAREKGDEFLSHGDDFAELKKNMDTLTGVLDNAIIEVETEDGRSFTMTGVKVSYGIDESLNKAEAQQKLAKKRRIAEGKRVVGRTGKVSAASLGLVENDTGRKGREDKDNVSGKVEERPVDEVADQLILAGTTGGEDALIAPLAEVFGITEQDIRDIDNEEGDNVTGRKSELIEEYLGDLNYAAMHNFKADVKSILEKIRNDYLPEDGKQNLAEAGDKAGNTKVQDKKEYKSTAHRQVAEINKAEKEKQEESKKSIEYTPAEWLEGIKLLRAGSAPNAVLPDGREVLLQEGSTLENYKEKNKVFFENLRNNLTAPAKKSKPSQAPILSKSGRPYKTKRMARLQLKRRGLADTHKVIEVEGGYGLVISEPIVEYGQEIKTGVKVTLPYVHNKESATGLFGIPDKNSKFYRGYEPSGKYMTIAEGSSVTKNNPQFETGKITFENPLVIDNDSLKWKKTLSERYDGKTGKALSVAIIKDGYDAVITVENGHTSEVLDLKSFDETKAKFSKLSQKPTTKQSTVKALVRTLRKLLTPQGMKNLRVDVVQSVDELKGLLGDGVKFAKTLRFMPKNTVAIVSSVNKIPRGGQAGPVYLMRNGMLSVDGNIVGPGDTLYFDDNNKLVKELSQEWREKVATSLDTRIKYLVKLSSEINRKIAKKSVTRKQEEGKDSFFESLIFDDGSSDWKKERYPQNANLSLVREYEKVDTISDKHDPEAIKEYVISERAKENRYVPGGYLHIQDSASIKNGFYEAFNLWRKMGGQTGKTIIDYFGETLYSKDGTIEGAFDPATGKITLVADNVSPERAWSILLHESIHKVKSEKGWAGVFGKRSDVIMKAINSRLARGDKAWKQAEQKAKDAGTREEDMLEETITYALADGAIKGTSLWKRIVNAIRAFLVNAGFKRNISDSDIQALAEVAIMRRAKQGEVKLGAVDSMIPAMASQFGVSEKVLQKEFDETKAKYKDEIGTAPNGKKSNLSGHLWVMVRTPRFRKWFGDFENDPAGSSQVVDENGEPLVVYHGTDQNIIEFDLEKLGVNTSAKSAMGGFFFTNNATAANLYPVYPQDLLSSRKKGVKSKHLRLAREGKLRKSSILNSPLFKAEEELGEIENEIKKQPEGRYRRISEIENIIFLVKELEETERKINNFNYDKKVNDHEKKHGIVVSEKVREQEKNMDIARAKELREDISLKHEDDLLLAAKLRDALDEYKHWSYVHKWSNKKHSGAIGDEVWYGKETEVSLQPNIMPVFISATKPLTHDQTTEYRDKSYADVVALAKEGGHDGVIIKNTKDPLPMDVYISFNPNQVKSIFNTGAFDPARDEILLSSQQAAKAIYSKLQQATEKFTGMKARSVANWLNKQGVKKTELEATGLDAWLKDKGVEKVSYSELSDFVRANMVETEDVVLGSDPGVAPLKESEAVRLNELLNISDERMRTREEESEYRRLNNMHGAYIADNKDSVTKFDPYQEPGAEEGSYREMFVTAPGVEKEVKSKIKLGDTVNVSFTERGKVVELRNDENGNLYGVEVRGSKRYYSHLFLKDQFSNNFGSDVKNSWKDGHPEYRDIKSPIVRIRFNTRIDKDGSKILFIEELQGPSEKEQKKMPAYLRDNIYQIGVKRALAYAKENGFDGVAWTTGSMQAERYDLSKQIDNLEITPLKDGTGKLAVYADGNLMRHATPETLDSLVGKEIAKKAIDDGVDKNTVLYSGIDLKVGGDGLKNLYDTIIPAMFKKYGKSKVVETSIDFDGNAKTVQAIPITQKTPATYQMFAKAVEATEQNLESDLGEVIEVMGDKVDIVAGESLISTPHHIFKKTKPTWRMFNAGARRSENKVKIENEILDDMDGTESTEEYKRKNQQFVKFFKDLKKKTKRTYDKVNKYLLETDRTGKAFTIKHKDESWQVLNREGKLDSLHPDSRSAIIAMMEGEAQYLASKGYRPLAVNAVIMFRKMTNRGFDRQFADFQKIIDHAKEMGLPAPSVSISNENKRWFAKKANRSKFFKTEQEALNYSNGRPGEYEVGKRTDKEIVEEVSLSTAMAQMGELRGSYFPRQRESGGVVLIATNKGGSKIRENFDLYITKRKKIDQVTGEEITEGAIKKLLRKAFNRYTPLGRRIGELRKKGFTIKVQRNNAMPESVFEAAQLMSSIKAMMTAGMKGKEQDAAYLELNKILSQSIADIFKARGGLSSRMQRAKDYWEGFETDMTKAGVMYGKGLAATIAKRVAAQEMTEALTGRDISWTQYKDDNESATFEDYIEFTKERGIDPEQQENIYKESMSWMREMLRNDERGDRIIGTLKGLAVVKFLGFRVSSATVNMTNLYQAVPATISSMTKGSLRSAVAEVTRSLGALHGYSKGNGSSLDKKIFTEIKMNGWDNPQFNHENAAQLRSNVGNWKAQFIDASMWMFGKAESINRAATIHAAYKQLAKKHPNMSHSDLMEQAHEISDNAHGIYGKLNAPVWTRGEANIFKAGYTFKTFSHNYMLNMGGMMSRGDKKNVAYMLLAPGVIAGGSATLATPIVAGIISAFGGGDDPEEEFYKWAGDTFGSDRIFRHGIFGLAGVNLTGSLQLNAPFPTSMKDVIGAPGSVVTDVVQGGEHVLKGEAYKAVEKLLPAGFGNVAKAIREYKEGITTSSYGPVYYGDEPLKGTMTDAMLRGISFNPSRLSAIREMQWSEKKIARKYSEQASEIRARIKRMFVQYGRIHPATWGSIVADIHRYNEVVSGLNRSDIRPMNIRKTLRRSFLTVKRVPKRERERQLSGI